MTNVPLLDLKAQYAQIRADVMPIIEEVCASQRFILGEHVLALEVGAGDEIITSPFTFFATAGTIARLGARPVFCDIDPVSFNLSPQAVSDFIGQHCRVQGGQLLNRATGGRVQGLMPVHLYGQSADMDPLMAVAKQYNLKVIEDAAQA